SDSSRADENRNPSRSALQALPLWRSIRAGFVSHRLRFERSCVRLVKVRFGLQLLRIGHVAPQVRMARTGSTQLYVTIRRRRSQNGPIRAVACIFRADEAQLNASIRTTHSYPAFTAVT